MIYKKLKFKVTAQHINEARRLRGQQKSSLSCPTHFALRDYIKGLFQVGSNWIGEFNPRGFQKVYATIGLDNPLLKQINKWDSNFQFDSGEYELNVLESALK